MTAIGFLLLVLGWLIINIWGHPSPRISTTGDYVGASAGLVGIVLIVIGVARWLWSVMP